MNLSDLDLLEQLALMEARENFAAFRRIIRGDKLKMGWFLREVAEELQQFYEDLIDGKRPKLIIEAPPQHGKSWSIIDFLAWVSGKNPELRQIYTSYSERLGVRANLSLQRIFDMPVYKKIFPDTRISGHGVPMSDSKHATRNRELLEFIGCEGYFRNTTVRGSITGESLDLGIIDDPIKGREEANSETVREATWNWLTDDFFSRFSDDAGLLAIMTRWHHDDPIGRLREHLGDKVKVLSYKAIATEDEKHRKEGEALFPEHKSIEFLLEREAVMASINWEALFQQNPLIVGGEIIKGEHFKRYKVAPRIEYRIIYADTAQKQGESNDYSVFECWGLGRDGQMYLLDLIRGKWLSPELRKRAKDFWDKHKSMLVTEFGQLRKMKVEDKSSGTGLIQDLQLETSIPIEGIPRDKDKYTRVLDVLGYIESGRVWIPESAPWVNDFIDECEKFTADDSHIHDDQIDPMVDAIKDMIANDIISTWAKLA